MKIFRKISLMLAITLMMMLALPTTVLAQSDDGETEVVLGGTFTLENGESLSKNLAIFGGTGYLEEDSEMSGDIFLAGGTLYISGEVKGDIYAAGGTLFLNESCEINGNIVLAAATLNKDSDAEINGDIINGTDSVNFNFSPDDFLSSPSTTTSPAVPAIRDTVQIGANFLFDIFWGFLKIVAMAGLAALIVLLLQKPSQKTAASMMAQPAVAGGIGLLTFVVALPLILLLTITIILIPVALLLILVWLLALLFGWTIVGLEIGKHIAVLLKQDWAPALSAGIGTFVLTLVMSLLGLIPCIGWMFWLIPASFGLGAVITSRFGTQIYGQDNLNNYSHPRTEPVVEAAFTETDKEVVIDDDEIDEDSIMNTIFNDEAENTLSDADLEELEENDEELD